MTSFSRNASANYRKSVAVHNSLIIMRVSEKNETIIIWKKNIFRGTQQRSENFI